MIAAFKWLGALTYAAVFAGNVAYACGGAALNALVACLMLVAYVAAVEVERANG